MVKPHAGEKENFILGCFYIILNLEVGRKAITPSLQWFSSLGGGSGGIHVYT
jgi:hypothetical protein